MLSNIKIGRLLTLAFITLIVFVVVVGGIGIYYLSESNKDSGMIYSDGLISVEKLAKMNQNILKIRANNTLMLYERDASQFDARNAEIAQWAKEDNDLLAQYEATRLTDEEKSILADYKNALALYRELRNKNLEMIKYQDYDGALGMASELTDARMDVQTLCEQLITANEKDAENLKDEIAANFKSSLLIMIGILAVAFAIAIALSITVPRSIKRPISELADVAEKVAEGDLSVTVRYRSKNEFGDLAVSISTVVDNLRRLIAEAKALTGSASKGKFDDRADAGSFGGGYRDILTGVNQTLDTVVDKIYWYESLLDSIPNPITVTDIDMNWTFVNKPVLDMLGTTREALMGKQCSNWNANICKTENCGIARLRNGYNETLFEQFGHNFHVSTTYLTDKNGERMGHIELVSDITKDHRKADFQKREVERLARNLESLAQGNLDLDFAVEAADEYTKADYDNFIKINDSFREARKRLSEYIGEISHVLGQMAEGNLDVEASGDFKGDFTQIKTSMNRIVDSLNEMLMQINQSSSQVLSGAEQVASAAQSLSQGSTEQASSIEELSASIEDISSQIKKNAGNAQNAKGIADHSSATVENANVQMHSMISAMENINESSQKISKIIKTIDEIAFQTNILALNAAVEAARAGEAGKGFAVVADEVRNLASKSADAAKDTTALIENSIAAVEEGTKIADETAKTLSVIVGETKRSGDLIGLISEASTAQAQAITQTTEGVAQISSVVQTNSATAQESAAASEELSGQADMLNQLVSKFRLRHSELSFETPAHKSSEPAYSKTTVKGSKY